MPRYKATLTVYFDSDELHVPRRLGQLAQALHGEEVLVAGADVLAASEPAPDEDGWSRCALARTGRHQAGPDETAAAMARLRAAERDRHAAIEDLIALGVVRSHVLVGDLGEQIAARYYDVDLAPSFTPGYDLVDRAGRRVQVKTLRGTRSGPRTIIGELRAPYDVLLALRLDYDFTPAEGLEIPAAVATEHLAANGKLNWTRKLADDPRVKRIPAEDLLGP